MLSTPRGALLAGPPNELRLRRFNSEDSFPLPEARRFHVYVAHRTHCAKHPQRGAVLRHYIGVGLSANSDRLEVRSGKQLSIVAGLDWLRHNQLRVLPVFLFLAP